MCRIYGELIMIKPRINERKVLTYQDLLDMDHEALVAECNRLEQERLQYYVTIVHYDPTDFDIQECARV